MEKTHEQGQSQGKEPKEYLECPKCHTYVTVDDANSHGYAMNVANTAIGFLYACCGNDADEPMLEVSRQDAAEFERKKISTSNL